MFSKLISTFLLMTWISSKILAPTNSILSKHKKMSQKKTHLSKKMPVADSGKNFVHLEDASDDSDDFIEDDEEGEEEEKTVPIPLICEYAGEKRIGFKLKHVEALIKPRSYGKCKNSVEYEVSHQIDWKQEMDESDLEGCKGIEYHYKKDGEDMMTTLYPVQMKDSEKINKIFEAGYYSSGTKTTVLFYDDLFFGPTPWMGEMVLSCNK